MTVSTATIYCFGKVVTRVTGLMLIAPVFSSAVLSVKIKLGLLLLISGVLLPTVSQAPEVPDLPAIMLALGGEFLVGLLIGFGYRLAMTAVSSAGEVIGLQMGLGAASLIDYNSGQNAALASNLYAVIFTIFFISMDGHHHMLLVLRESFSILSPRQDIASLPAPDVLLPQLAYALSAGFRLAAVILVPLMMLTVAMGLVSRAFPQANIYSVSYGVSMLLGIVLMGLSMPAMRGAIFEITRNADRSALRILHSLAGT